MPYLSTSVSCPDCQGEKAKKPNCTRCGGFGEIEITSHYTGSPFLADTEKANVQALVRKAWEFGLRPTSRPRVVRRVNDDIRFAKSRLDNLWHTASPESDGVTFHPVILCLGERADFLIAFTALEFPEKEVCTQCLQQGVFAGTLEVVNGSEN